MPKEPDITWISHTSAQEGCDAIKRLLAGPITLDTLRLLQAAEAYETTTAQPRASLQKAIKNAIGKVSSQLTAESTKKLTSKKAPATDTPVTPTEVTTESPQDPQWDHVRQSLVIVRNAGRSYLYLQAWFGWVLALKKKEHQSQGGGRGGDRKSTNRPTGPLIPWAEKVATELGVPCRTADRFITLHEGFKAKLKRVAAKAPKESKPALALALFETANPLSLAPEKLEQLQEIAASLCEGESQASLMQELNLIPTPKVIKSAAPGKKDQEPAEQLAFKFWSSHASAICDARAQGEKALYLLPLESDDPAKPGLLFLQSETAALLKSIEEAMATHKKGIKKA